MTAPIKIDCTTNYLFLHESDNIKVSVLEGSSRSSKTYSIVQFLVYEKLTKIKNYVARCWRFNTATHNDTTIQDFKDVMADLGERKGIPDFWNKAGRWNGQEKVYRFENGSVMAFSGTMDAQKIQGKKQNCSWFNEVMEVSQAAYRQAAMRTTEKIILDFNPSFNHHWVFDSVMKRIKTGEVAYKHSTYKDNKFLPDEQVQEIESYNPEVEQNKINGTADQWTWDVYGLGKRGKIEGAVFDFFEVWDGDFPQRFNCQRHGYGMDFGFTLDPSTLIECALFQDILYVREIIYETGLLITPNLTRPEIPNIVDHMKRNDIDKEEKIYADCAAPESIEDIRLSGYNIVACEKGKGSILQGINLLKRRKIRVCRNSLNIQREFEHYKWKKRPISKISDDHKFEREPEDKFNHAIDAIRYWARAELQRAQSETMHANRGGVRKIRVKSGLRSRRR